MDMPHNQDKAELVMFSVKLEEREKSQVSFLHLLRACYRTVKGYSGKGNGIAKLS